MPEIKFPSDWLKINDNVQEGDTIRFADAGTLDPENDQYVFNVDIFHGGVKTETKKFNLNRTNFKVINAVYGTNSDAWVGKDMVVNKLKVRNPQTGLMVDSIALTAPVTK